MTTSEATQKKQALEKEILRLVTEFEQYSATAVTGISVKTEAHPGVRLQATAIRVDVKILDFIN